MSNKILYQAHRGVSTDYPENTMAAFSGAVNQGYDVIELDPNVTKDGVFVVLHDATINRTGRNTDGTEFEREIKINEITYDEVRQYDFGLWFSSDFEGEKLPLMEDVLEFSQAHGIPLKIDNKIENFNPDTLASFLELLHKADEELIIFTCKTIENAKRFAKEFPKAQIHYDGPVSKMSLEELTKAVPDRRCTVWVPIESSLTSWVNVSYADEKLCNMIKEYADIGIWILSEEKELERAIELGADIIETTGSIKPRR